MNKELEARFDLRVNKNLKDKFIRYCKSKKLTLSDAGRDALTTYVFSKTLIDTMVINLQNPSFFKDFNNIYPVLPEDLKNALNNLLAPEEEKLVKSTPPQLLNSVNVITDRGQKALKRLL
jgi:hypothetical protein